MPGWPIRKNDAAGATLVFPIYDNDGDLVTAAATLDSERSIDQGTFADCTNEAAEIATSSGMYSLALTQAEINGDEIAVITKTTTTDAKTAVNVVYTSTRNIDDLAFPTVSGRSLDVAATGEAGIDLDNAVGALGTAQFDAGYFTAALFAAGAVDAAALNADAVTEIRSIANGTADAGGTTTTLVDAALTEIDDTWNGSWLLLTSGTDANRVRLITDFDAASDTITFAPAVSAAIGAGVTYEILPAGSVDVQSWLATESALQLVNALVAGRVDADVGNMQNDTITAAVIAAAAITSSEAPNLDVAVSTRLAPTVAARTLDVTATGEAGIDLDNAAGALGTAQFDAGFFTAALFAAGALDANALATDAVGEIADGVWDEPLTGHATLASFGQVINAMGARTGEVADVGPLAGDFDVDGFTEATDDHFNGMVLVFTSGVLTGQARVITDYTGTGQNCVFAEPFTEAPADNDDFVILPPGMVAGGTLQQVLRLFVTVLDQATGQLDSGSFAANALDDAAIAADAFDGMFIRDIDQVEASAPVHSITSAILKAVSRVRDNAGTLEVYRTDAATIHMSQTVTVDAALDPVDELSVGS